MKIALVGSAPASVRMAPYSDPTWQIYGCSPGVYGVAARVTEWFELHRWEPGQPWFSPEYVQWMTALPQRGATLWVGGVVPSIPESKIYPFDEVLADYDPQRWFCSSSLFWMMARAIEAIKDEAAAAGRTISSEHDKIAFYGVDMAAESEYEMQRAGIHFMAYRAAALGIEVGAPPESDLFTPRFRYGADEWTHSFVKMRARRAELEARMKQAEEQMQAARDGMYFLKGAVEDLKYCHETWADKGAYLGITPPAAMANTDQGHAARPVMGGNEERV
jgi:hypothetical protein